MLHFSVYGNFLEDFLLYKIWNLMFSIKKSIIFVRMGLEKFFPQHWRSSHYAVTHVHNKNSNIQGRSSKVVKVIFHTIRNCPLGANSFL